MERHTDNPIRQFAKENEPVTTTKRTRITIEELTLGFQFDEDVWKRYAMICDEENDRHYKNEMD
jgi:hypothetical protein